MSESKSDALPLGYEAKLQVVERGGFEPPNPKEQIYSLPRLASSLSLQVVPKTGIEPVTYWLQVSCSTNWAIPAKFIILIHKLLYININKIAIINFFIFLYLIRMVPYFISYISKLHLWHKKKSYLLIIIKLVPRAGIEPARVSPPAGF